MSRIILLALSISVGAHAQDGGIVVDGSAVVTTDAGIVHILPSAVCLDETASIRVARELASRRAIEPVLRETPVVPVTPTTIVVTNAVSIALGVVLGAWGGVTVCRETQWCR